MAGPGNRTVGDDLAPVFALHVEGKEVSTDITTFIKEVEYESAIDMADILKLRVHNPGFMFTEQDNQPPDWLGHKVFQPGNEVDLFIGYGFADTFIGRVQLAKHLPSFPEDGIPMLEIQGYDRSHLMMGVEGDISGAAAGKPSFKQPRPADAADDKGRIYANKTHSQVVLEVTDRYGFLQVVDETTRVENVVQKKGMSDYALVKGLGNVNRKEFKVRYNNELRQWTAHWTSPTDDRSPQFKFQYGLGDASTLLTFDCEYGLRETINEVAVYAFDRARGTWISALVLEDAEGPDPKFRAGGGLASRRPDSSRSGTGLATSPTGRGLIASGSTGSLIEKTLSSATEFRLAAGGVAIDVIAGRPFKSVEEAADFAQRWFLARKDNFLVGTGQLIGVETLQAGQVHILEGLGKRLSGPYYFITVKHKMNEDNPYTIEFTARKIVE